MTDDVKPRQVARKPRKDQRRVKRVTGDLAELVRDRTLADVKAGKLKPTLQHGLMAQQMIDKREERAADRQLAIKLARMLGGTDGATARAHARDLLDTATGPARPARSKQRAAAS